MTRRLPTPFLVLATENPIDQEGTFPLPEAQLDRFAMRTGLGYPHEDEEVSIVLAQRHGHPIDDLDGRDRHRRAAATCRRAVEDVYVDELLLRWIVELVRATRRAEGVAIGASVRGSLTLERTARAWALLQGRGYVVPADVERAVPPGPRAPDPADRVLSGRDARARAGGSARAGDGALPGARAAARFGLGTVTAPERGSAAVSADPAQAPARPPVRRRLDAPARERP